MSSIHLVQTGPPHVRAMAVRSHRHVIASRIWLPLLAIAGSPQSGAGQVATVRGTITDSATGQPLSGAFVAAIRSQRYGRVRSDSAGRYVLDRIPPGATELEFHCPSATALGWPIEARVIRLRTGQDTVVNVRVSRDLCGEPPYSERRGIFRGTYSSGFEHSNFAPCPDSALGVPLPRPNGVGFWSAIWVRLDSLASQPPQGLWPTVTPDSTGHVTFFVRWRGVLRGPGVYGHLGVSAYQLVVDSVYSVRPRNQGSC
jgi:hypothetical protein